VADEFDADLLDKLRRHPDAGGSQKLLDVCPIQFHPVGLADAVDHLHLQRDDRHGRQ